MEKIPALPVKQGLLDRPRIDALLTCAVRDALVTVVAGPGYGKTQAVASFMANTPARRIWINSSHLKNTPAHFWAGFMGAASETLPGRAERLASIGFPGTPARLASFLQLLEEESRSGAPLYFIADDYGRITHPKILRLFEHIVEAGLKNFCLVVISSTKTNIGVIGLRNGGLSQITAEDLRFTEEEARRLFLQSGLSFSASRLKELLRRTDGWPLALHLLSVQPAGSGAGLPAPDACVNPEIIRALFQEAFFSAYSPEVRHLGVKLALLPAFSLEIVKAAGNFDMDEANALLRSNLFIRFDPASRLYSCQNMYRAFLAERAAVLEQKEKEDFYSMAGDVFLARGDMPEAMDCFEKCGRHEALFLAVKRYSGERPGLLQERADYILEKLEALPAGFSGRHPYADYIKAAVYFCKMEFGRCRAFLAQLETRLQKAGTPEAFELLGEVYVLMGAVRMFCFKEDFADYFKKAVRCLPQGMPAGRPKLLYVGNRTVMGMDGSLPGALSRMEKAMHGAAPYYRQAARGDAGGLAQLFSAEAHFFTMNFSASKQHAFLAIKEGAENRQHDIVCNACYILARVALMQGDFNEMAGQINLLQNHIDEHKIEALYALRDCAAGWMHLKMGAPGKISPWILSPDFDARQWSVVTHGRDLLLYLQYLLHNGKYDELMLRLDQTEQIYAAHGNWAAKLTLHILRAICYMRRRELPAAMDAFRKAYGMSHQNHVIQPFVEFFPYLRGLMETAKDPGSPIEPEWADRIGKKASSFSKRLSAVVKEYRAHDAGAPRSSVCLSKREKEVLHDLSQGFTREEIASSNYVSINTVKSEIRNIYNKLGAVNRADAVRISTVLGILK
ncbi:MAG: LuxR C-terminal-related transcriptional regulator [Clostridiales Family XIII bacterium]|jgi:LuxR family maltose regulon positive regulatory protein|nr:LuxR C-terminal-related transcriptional regulator [Clostridiales Family XIII bacterium]